MNATTVKARLHDLTHPTGVEDTLSVDFPNNRPFRLAITPPAAIGVAILCALVGVGFIAWHFCAPSPANPTAGARLSPHATMPLVPASAAATTVSAPMSVIVAVVGEVDRPGLHTFAPTARVADALAAAQPKPQAQTLGLANRLSSPTLTPGRFHPHHQAFPAGRRHKAAPRPPAKYRSIPPPPRSSPH